MEERGWNNEVRRNVERRNSPRKMLKYVGEEKKTWYSKARFNSGIHMSSSKYCLVMGEITCDALRALLTISFLFYQLSLLQFPLSLFLFQLHFLYGNKS